MLTSIGVLLLLVLMGCHHTHVAMCSFNGNFTDQLSLLEFQKGISDPKQALMSWNDSTHFCSWEGVLCSVKHPDRVTSLNLTRRGLVGEISPSLGNLTFLKVLLLNLNSFSGEIPPSLGQLHRLQILKLDYNTLQGVIPSLANCSNLKELWLRNNQLTGPIPIDIPHALEKLILSLNNLTGTIPTSLANITTLSVLDVAFNSIEGNIPNEFAKLSALQFLFMGRNKLSGYCFPQPILNLSVLVRFSVAYNDLRGDVPSYIGNSLPNLEIFELDNNFFHGHIPSSLTNASKLTLIDISSNRFAGVVPRSIGKLSRLYSLNLESNKLLTRNMQDWEFMDSLANCTELQEFSITENHLEGNVPYSIGNLSRQLQILYMADNHLSGVFPSGLANLRNLITVGLSMNRFVGVLPEWIGTLTNVQVVLLSNNFFSGAIPSSFSNMSQLEELDLDFNRFDGQIPQALGNLQMLRFLNIPNNNLHGSIPKELFRISTIVQIILSSNNLDGTLHDDIGNAKQLTYLHISSNNISGEIPRTLGNCESLEDINLDHNAFSGNIPASLGGITSLQILNLSHNNLTGSIPTSLANLKLLELLDLSFNHLNGDIPTKGIFSNVTAMWIDGNPGLCGGALELHLPACPAKPLYSSKQHQSILWKVMVPLATLLSLAMVVSIIVLWRGKQKRKSVSLPTFGSTFPKVSYNDLYRGTEGFSVHNLIGKGRYSSVYQGKLFEDRTMVAVKVFSLETKGTQKSFVAECNALRNVRHRNLVRIITACSSTDSKGNDFKALVYEFMPRGDLHALLYSTRDDGDISAFTRITLAQRICIVVHVADALEYLHHNNQGAIVHCDLKASNILLDENMIAHVGDFGLARFRVDPTTSSFADVISASSIAIKGTVGYVPPEYATGDNVSCAGDVYSFGIVLLEIFLRKRPTDHMFKDGLNISKFVEINFPDRILQIVDPHLLVEEPDLSQEISVPMKEKSQDCIPSVLKIGLYCANPSPNERMEMQEVAARLHRRKESYLSEN